MMKTKFLHFFFRSFLTIAPLVFFLNLWGADNTSQYKSDFLSLCKAHQASSIQNLKVCDEVDADLFKNLKAIPGALNREILSVPELYIDRSIEYIMISDPNYMAALGYCYFVFKRFINPNVIGPDMMGSMSSGMSILNENIDEYLKWLSQSSEGKKCKLKVEKETEMSLIDLKASLKNKLGIIALNPYALVQNQTITMSKKSILDELTLVVHHERIHVLQVDCPAFEKWSMDYWLALKEVEKEKYRSQYNSYQWKNTKVAGRESVAFYFESRFNDLKATLQKTCPHKLSIQ